MIRLFSISLLVAMAGASVGRASQKTHKVAVVVGNNQGHDTNHNLRFAERDAKKMFDVLTELGGFDRDRSQLLLGQTAETVWKAVTQLEMYIKSLSGEATKTLLVFYYSGHADGDVLELGRTVLHMKTLLTHLQSSGADVRVAFLDSCRSGKLITMKGGRRGPGFTLRLADEIASKGYAIVTSSAETELSQESKEIRGAFFTHYLVSALRGAGDESQDGKVTLSEAYAYAYRKTLARTSVTIGGSQHPMYEFQLEGRGDVVLTRTDDAQSRLTIKLPERGRLIVLDSHRETIVTETEIAADAASQLAIRAGEFQVYLVTPDGGVRASEITLHPDESATLDSTHFQSVDLELAIEKGGLFADAGSVVHTISAGGMWRMFALEGAASSVGAAFGYRVELANHFQPILRLSWSTRNDVGKSQGYNDVGALLGIGYVVGLRQMKIRVELLSGYEHLIQKPREGKKRHTSGFDYLGIIGLALPKDHLVLNLDGAVGGRTFQVVDKGWVHRLDLQVILSLGWQWGWS